MVYALAIESLTTIVPVDQEAINKDESTRIGLIRDLNSLHKCNVDWIYIRKN